MHESGFLEGSDSMSRRRFLALAASTAGASFLGRANARAPDGKLVMPPGTAHSRVIRVCSPHVVNGPVVHRHLLNEMFQAAIKQVVPGARTTVDAWRSLLRPDDIIGIKFNRSGQEILGTTPYLADTLIRSIIDAGWPAEQIVLIEAPAETASKYKTTPPRPGYSTATVDFGSGSDRFGAVLDQVTALIDVPYLKTHNIAGVTCALKNLSHGLVKHPARYHSNGCSPYIAEIVASEPIRRRIRLCLVDALRVVFDGGPDASVGKISDEGILLLSIDPVATDTTGVAVLEETRRRIGLPRLVRSPEELDYLAVAHRLGLGIAIPHGIDVLQVEP